LDIVKLKARPRSGSGKSYTRKARVHGWIPAIYYGRNRQPKTIEIDALEFTTLVRTKKTRSLFNLGLTEEGGGESVAIIKEIQRDVINRKKFLHIDFQRVAMDEKVTVGVPVELTGLPPIGVKEMGGVLQHPAKIIRVECLPANIPDKIFVDVSLLKIGDSIHIRDITVPNAVIKDSPDEVVAVVIIPTAEEVKAAEPTAEGVEGAEGAVAAEGAEGAEGAAPAAEGAEGAAGKPDAAGKPAAAGKPGAAAKPGAPAKPGAAPAAGGAAAKGGKDAKGPKGGK
jgi:large subunit ribosomal protein L25